MIANRKLSRQPAWRRALLAIGGLHALAFGALFVRLSTATEPDLSTQAIAVEMATLAAPPAPVRDALTPRQVEAPKQTREPTPQPKQLPFDPPPLQQASDARPEVVLPLKKEELPRTEEPHPLPPAPTTTEQAAPALKPDTKMTAPTLGGASAGVSTAANLWDARVLSRIETTKRYPYQAIRNDQQDDVEVLLAIDRTGRLREALLGANRGFALLNEAALEAVRRAAPFQEPPDDVEGDPVRISVTVRFVKSARRN